MARELKLRVAASVVALLLGLAYFRLGRGYPWSLAVLMGTACGALTYSVLQTVVRLVSIHRDS